jgi:hypothetical protein
MDEATNQLFITEISELIRSRQEHFITNYPDIREIYQNSYDGDTTLILSSFKNGPRRNEIEKQGDLKMSGRVSGQKTTVRLN